MALDALDLGEQLKSARCVSYPAEFRQNLAVASSSADVQAFTEQATEHKLWVAAAPTSAVQFSPRSPTTERGSIHG